MEFIHAIVTSSAITSAIRALASSQGTQPIATTYSTSYTFPLALATHGYLVNMMAAIAASSAKVFREANITLDSADVIVRITDDPPGTATVTVFLEPRVERDPRGFTKL
jgi:hypothetical protein